MKSSKSYCKVMKMQIKMKRKLDNMAKRCKVQFRHIKRMGRISLKLRINRKVCKRLVRK